MLKGTFFCIDAHTCGNPVRLITSGHPVLRGSSMSEKRQDFIQHHDWIRQALMFEPRGHDMMSGAFLYPPVDEAADGAILFVETSGCLPMCGHGTIGVVTAALESGLLQAKRPGSLQLEVPAGQIKIDYAMENGKVLWVKIYNVASYLAYENIELDVPGLGELQVDISYGGNFYIIVEPQANFPGIEHWSAAQILHYSPMIRRLVNEKIEPVHPLDPTVRGASHLLWTGKASKLNSDAANAVFYGDKAIDRSPCGTGTSARMAQLYAKGKLGLQQDFVHESYIGSQFIGRAEGVCEVGNHSGILPSIQGWAKVTGQNCISVDDDDPYAFGFQVI
jgi:4-hydroxyproline epimerase